MYAVWNRKLIAEINSISYAAENGMLIAEMDPIFYAIFNKIPIEGMNLLHYAFASLTKNNLKKQSHRLNLLRLSQGKVNIFSEFITTCTAIKEGLKAGETIKLKGLKAFINTCMTDYFQTLP